MLDEAQRIKNWATKTALSVKRLTPAYRLVLTGTPMENRIEELASIVEWVDDLALEPKWRLAALHAMRADGRQRGRRASATSIRSASGSRAAWCGGSARMCSTSFRREPTPASRSS